MTDQIFLEETTLSQLTQVFFPRRSHAKLSRSATEFFISEHQTHTHGDTDVHMATLIKFVEFLITKKGYN